MERKESLIIFTRAWLLWNDAQPVEKRLPICYRLDTDLPQVWESDEHRQKLGLHLTLDVGDTMEPFVTCLGPYVLCRHRYLHRAVEDLCTRVGNSVLWAQWHISAAGHPCHEDCDC